VGTLVFILNPNILYLQITPLSELVLIATLAMSAYYFLLWTIHRRENKVKGRLLAMINTQGEEAPDYEHGVSASLTAIQSSTFLTTRSLSVVLPAHNEEGAIATTVHSIVETLLPWVPDFEVIVVNDGSQDNTRAIVEAIALSDPHVRLITHEANQGYGATLVTGFEAVTKNLAFFTDSDGQFDPRDLAPFFPLIEQYDAVLGYRINRQDTWLRKLNAWGWHLLVATIFGVQVRDVDCAFKLYRVEFFLQNRLETRGAMINAEILYKLKRSGCTMTEVGVRHLPRATGKATGAKPSVILRAFREMFYYARKWRREERQQRALTDVI
jgi:glycosyltransferase involved in cell wall biosynthesis